MLNASASASSSNALNFLPDLCFGLEDCVFRGAGDLDAPPPPPERRADESLEKNCCVEERAGLGWLVLEI